MHKVTENDAKEKETIIPIIHNIVTETVTILNIYIVTHINQ